MRWKKHKKLEEALSCSFLFVLFVTIFLSSESANADTNDKILFLSKLSDKQLIALIAQSDHSSHSSASVASVSPPKINGHDIFMSNSTSSLGSVSPAASIPINHNSSQRCMYNNQEYVLGDMVNSAIGWLRCAPTFFFSSDSPMMPQQNQSAWIKVQ